jgi:hypothetical protein
LSAKSILAIKNDKGFRALVVLDDEFGSLEPLVRACAPHFKVYWVTSKKVNNFEKMWRIESKSMPRLGSRLLQIEKI